MARKVLCELLIKNKKNGIRTIGSSILAPKQLAPIKFYTIGQLKDALAVQRHGGIEIKTSIPKEFEKELNIKVEEKEVLVDSETTDEIEKAKVAEEAKLAEETKAAEEAKLAEEAKVAEEAKITEAKAAEEAKVAEEAKAAEEAKITSALTREEVIEKSKSELRAYATENEIELEGINSRSSATSVTNAMLNHFGFEELEAEEKA